MEFLRLLEAARTPVVAAFMAAITYMGDETVFMVLAITMFWCVSKRQGYYVFAVGLGGTVINQWLKLIFRIPRPWVLDPNFTIVESARAAATGYSFPSGHTQNIVGTLGAIAVANRQKWLRVCCCVFVILVPFSRMYLGVHTPLDVGVSFAAAVVLVAALWPCFRDDAQFHKTAKAVLCGLLALTLCYVVWVNVTAFPVDVDAENLEHGVKNGWTLLGCVLGLIVSYWFDETKLHFDEKASLLGQICKLVIGLVLLVGVRAGAKPVLNAVTGGAAWANAVRYFLMVVFAGCVWPLTFPYFAKVGKKSSK